MDPDEARVVDPVHVTLDGRSRGGGEEALVIGTMVRNSKTQRSQAPCPSTEEVASAISKVRRISPSDHEWLLSIERAVGAVGGGGPRCRGMFVDARDPESPRVWAEPRPAVEAVESVRSLITTWPRGSARGFLRRLLFGATCFTVSTRLDEELYRSWATDARTRGAPCDALCVAACAAPGVGAILWFPLMSRSALPRATGYRWQEIADALLKAVEARFGDAIQGRAASPFDASLAGPLASEVRERARERMSSGSTPTLSPGEASVFRRELLRGEWSLLDHFDRDGKRYFTWTRDVERRRALTRREQDVLARVARGQADRSIALELSCSPSTVATHRLRAMSKLGLSSRTLFSQILASVVGDEAPS
jgi:DNA-binding CsgD family transcriptional regulator